MRYYPVSVRALSPRCARQNVQDSYLRPSLRYLNHSPLFANLSSMPFNRLNLSSSFTRRRRCSIVGNGDRNLGVLHQIDIPIGKRRRQGEADASQSRPFHTFVFNPNQKHGSFSRITLHWRRLSNDGRDREQTGATLIGGGQKVTVHYASTNDNEESDDAPKSPRRLSQANQRRQDYVLKVDHDKGLFKQIRNVQSLKREQARRKTAANVNRALVGNVVICTAKFGAWLASGSSSMLSEFIHSVVDCGNQGLLLVGLKNAQQLADRSHPYGYGKSVYFWALVSALGTFFLGAGVSMTHAIGDLMQPSLHEITWHVWAVLGISLGVDGYVLRETLKEVLVSKPSDVSLRQHLARIRDPAILAVLLEDGAACLGILIACGGISLSHAFGNPIFDGIAGVTISALLGAMGLVLVRMNHRFLLGQAVDREIIDDIEKILLSRRSIDSIGSVQTQWISSDTFSYKAEVDFDGTYLAAKLMPIYQHEFIQIQDSLNEELQVLLSFYAEDVIRTVEREVRHVEALIRKKYPGAEYIELEPMSRDADRLAIYDNIEDELRRVESDALNRYLKSLRKEGSMEGIEIPTDVQGGGAEGNEK